jgi:hypothetical protein
MILDDLYASEINYTISSDWDGGINVGLGNERNGFKAQTMHVPGGLRMAARRRDRALPGQRFRASDRRLGPRRSELEGIIAKQADSPRCGRPSVDVAQDQVQPITGRRRLGFASGCPFTLWGRPLRGFHPPSRSPCPGVRASYPAPVFAAPSRTYSSRPGRSGPCVSPLAQGQSEHPVRE